MQLENMLHSTYLKAKMKYQLKLTLLSEEAVLDSSPPLHVFIKKRDRHCVVSGS